MSNTARDEVLPDGAWTFDESVAAVFTDMLRRSIPQYEEMRALVFRLARRFVRPSCSIVDLGCAHGEALAPFVETFGGRARYLGVDVSAPMLAAARERFADAPATVEIAAHDLRTGVPDRRAAVILAVLTVQFVPIEYRQRLLTDVYTRLEPGGAFVLVEKVIGANAVIDSVLVDEYYAMKREHGYTQEQIDRKRLALEGVLVPLPAVVNVELLRGAGFDNVDCFWRWLNFAGWLAVKRA